MNEKQKQPFQFRFCIYTGATHKINNKKWQICCCHFVVRKFCVTPKPKCLFLARNEALQKRKGTTTTTTTLAKLKVDRFKRQIDKYSKSKRKKKNEQALKWIGGEKGRKNTIMQTEIWKFFECVQKSGCESCDFDRAFKWNI